MIDLRKTVAAGCIAVSIAAIATPATAQYYNYYVPRASSYYYNYPQTYTTPGGWGERGSNGWTYHGGGFDLGYGSNGCVYTSEWSNC
ncbi:MAG: hypothetical protein ACREDG_00885 [Methylocella sp.]